MKDVNAIHVDVDQRIMVARSDGSLTRDHRVRTRLTCRETARRDGRTETGFDGPGLGGGLELYDDDPPEHIAARAARLLDIDSVAANLNREIGRALQPKCRRG